jgi:molybdenum cofactor biosynthesis protein B
MTPTGRRSSPRRTAHPHAGHAGAARCAIVTVSDTRTPADDRSGAELQRSLERGGHFAVARLWVRDEAPAIRRAAAGALRRRDVDAVLLTGGTGIAPRDVTAEAVAPLVQRWLPGFGELFRMLSYREVGAAAWLSRAAAGVARGKLLVILPGSPAAVRLAADRLLVPELGHALGLLRPPGRKR